MTEKNVLKGISIDKRREVLIEEFKSLGSKSFDINLSSQAKEIIANYGDSFPLEKFKLWWLENFAVVNGSQLHRYFVTQIDKDLI